MDAGAKVSVDEAFGIWLSCTLLVVLLVAGYAVDASSVVALISML